MQQAHESVHGLVGVGQQHLPLAHLLDDRAVAIQACRPLGSEGLLGEGRAALGRQARAEAPGVAHVQRHLGHKDLVLGQAQLVQQQLLHRAREGPLAFQAHRGQAAALLQDALHVLAIVLALLLGALGGIQVGVARNAHDIGVLHRVHREDFGHPHLDGVLDEHVGQALAGQLNDAVGLARQRDNAEGDALGAEILRLLPLAILGALGFLGLGASLLLLGLLLLGSGLLVEPHDDIEAAVLQMREGVARVHDLRRKERQHVVGHVVVQGHELLIGQIVLAQLADVFLSQQAAQVLESFLVVRVQLMAARVHGVQLLGRRHAGFRIDNGLLQQREVGERSHAHHEEFLEVAPKDGDEVQAFQKRHRRVGTLIKYALVEIEPGELTILHIGGL